MTTDKLIAEMDKALQFPGVANAWTMPIKARTDMLSTGIRTPIGIRSSARTWTRWSGWPRRSRPCVQVPAPPAPLPSASPAALSQHRARPRQLARHGPDGGRAAGRHRHRAGWRDGHHHRSRPERFGVTVRYPRELRADPASICRVHVLVPTMGAHDAARPAGRGHPGARASGIRTETPLSATSSSTSATGDIGVLRADAARRSPRGQPRPATTYLERPVREHGARHRGAEVVVPVTLLLIIFCCSTSTSGAHRNADRDAVGALRAGRRVSG